MCIIKRLGISATYRRYKFFNDNLFVPLEWNAGVLECWNIGNKSGKQSILFKL